MEQYELYVDMFYKKVDYSEISILDDVSQSGKITEQIIDVQKEKLSHVWQYGHLETIRENKQILYAWLNDLKAYNEELKIIFLVTPQAKYLEMFWKNEFEICKNDFYKTLESFKGIVDFEIWDYYNLFYEKDEYFIDTMHLNKYGAAEFSKVLEKRLKKEVYDK